MSKNYLFVRIEDKFEEEKEPIKECKTGIWFKD